MARIEIDKMSKLLQVYFIMGSNNCTRDPSCIERSVRWWSDTFQFREKGKVL